MATHVGSGNTVTPGLGAKVVARAWVDKEFKKRLLADAKNAIVELGIESHMSQLIAVENTNNVHNVIVCTLCSCYPTVLLGSPPDWYKGEAYRTRVVSNPRGMLKEFGLELETAVEVKVHDSTADCRYLVIPQRPASTKQLDEDKLASLVTRDSMIGVATVHPPGGETAAWPR